MYRKEKPLVLKSSASSLTNNLSVLVALEKGVLNYAVVHKAVVNIISASTDGSTVNSRNIVCKEPSAAQQSTPMIIQVYFLYHIRNVSLRLPSIHNQCNKHIKSRCSSNYLGIRILFFFSFRLNGSVFLLGQCLF